MVFKRTVVVALAGLVAGCSLDSQPVPGFTGPSEFALSLALSVDRDVIPQDGVTSIVITVQARDEHGQPKPFVSLMAETAVNGTVVDFGKLTSKTTTTDGSGIGRFTYTAPPPPPPTVTSDTLLTVVVTPVGSNYANSLSRSIQVRLARPGVILPPNGTPTADFFFSPTQPKEHETILFDASSSSDPDGADDIVSYSWGFGDGAAKSGIRVTHGYALAGTYNVTLVVTDKLGRTSQVVKTVTVGVATAPVASFVISPNDPVVGTQVFFNAAASKASPGFNLVSWEWDFGDGVRTSGGPTADHTYAAAGTYNIVLVVTDSSGQKATAAVTMTVGTP